MVYCLTMRTQITSKSIPVIIETVYLHLNIATMVISAVPRRTELLSRFVKDGTHRLNNGILFHNNSHFVQEFISYILGKYFLFLRLSVSKTQRNPNETYLCAFSLRKRIQLHKFRDPRILKSVNDFAFVILRVH
jgi:hypothetical protein